MRAGCWHSQHATDGTSPNACLPRSALYPRYCQRQTHPPSLALPAWPKLLAPAVPGWPPSPVYIDMPAAMTLQEAGASGPGLVGVG